MKDEQRQRSRCRRRCLIAATFLFSSFILPPSSFLQADNIWVSTGGGNPLELPRVQINDIREGKVFFVGSSGRETSRELAQVTRLGSDDDPNLGAAETAFASGMWDRATDGYRKVLSTSPKTWARSWAAQRLVESAQKANRFDAAASGYIALLLADPIRARNFKPTLPDERSTYLNTALAEVAANLAEPRLTQPQRNALLGFQLDLQRAKKDQKAANQTMEQLLQSSAVSGSDPAAV